MVNKMKNLTKGEHAYRLMRLYTFQENILGFIVNNDLDDSPGATEEAKEWMLIKSKAGIRIKDYPNLIIEWYNLQFGTDFTEEQIKKLSLLA